MKKDKCRICGKAVADNKSLCRTCYPYNYSTDMAKQELNRRHDRSYHEGPEYDPLR